LCDWWCWWDIVAGVVDSLSLRLVPDELWEIVVPLIPVFPSRPQGGGTAVTDDRAVFTAIVFVLTSGCAWRHPRRRSG
jgi:transposase